MKGNGGYQADEGSLPDRDGGSVGGEGDYSIRGGRILKLYKRNSAGEDVMSGRDHN